MIIDLRSDTVTKPSKEMMNAIAQAKLGDDVYGEDTTVNKLQEYIADLLGKEAAIFVPTGTMSNQIGVKIHTAAGDEVIIEKDAHIFYFETAGPAIISSVQLRTLDSVRGEMNIAEIEEAIRPDVYYFPKTKLVCLENTHNRHGGSILSLDYINQVSDVIKRHNFNNTSKDNIVKYNYLAFHLDGARIWNAAVATGINLKDYARPFDTVSVCLSKGLGSPSGSVLVGKKEQITVAKKWRKILGGGMRQVGILAAAGLFAVKNNIERLAEDHENAKYFAKEISEIDEIKIDLSTVETNMVVFGLSEKMLEKNMTVAELVAKCKAKGLLFNAIDKNKVRIVFHLDISRKDVQKAVEIIKSVFA